MIGLLVAGTGSSGAISEKVEETWWAFRPLARPAVPASAARQSANPVDAFVLGRLSERGLTLSPAAGPRERLRRLYFDLVGLPPTPAEVAAFERDPSPAAWTRCIEELLARPQYGERWGRHWLDVVRFAQSNGYERDGEKLHAWKYRDYVIRSFNQDKPYDRFMREQVAGDELAATLLEADGTPGQAWRDAMVATGFLRLGVHDDEPDDKLQAEFDELDDMVATSGAVFLGMTVGCARCHDHKFDPIPQRDYYSMLAIFRPLKEGTGAGHTLDSPLFAPLAGPTQISEWQAGQDRQRVALETRIAATSDPHQQKVLKQELAGLQKSEPPFEWALVARERTNGVPAVHVLSRGNPRTPGAEVQPGFLSAAGGETAVARRTDAGATSGRRTALGEWLASPENPLAARVMVNRIWHHHFGRGLVRTTTDFGRVGSLPSHPELLDWLACEFIRNGWSVKALHRIILTSAVWNQSSTVSNPAAVAADPGNEWLWRQNLRRLDAEALRDSLLSISGQLNLQAGGRGIFPVLSGEVLAGGSRPGTDWEMSPPDELARRSVYTYIRRTSMVPLLETFDYSNASSPLSERPTTTVAPQALMLLNDAFVQEQAGALAARVTNELPDAPVERRLERAWTLATSRFPTTAELRPLTEYFERQATAWAGLDHRVSFRPDVPDTLSVPYFQSLPANRFLVGPSGDWEYHKGYWPREYEGNRMLSAGRGPFALWTGATVSEGTLDVEIVPQVSCSQVGILWGAEGSPDGGGGTGRELVLEPRDGRASVRALTPTNSVVLASMSGLTLREDRIQVQIRIGKEGTTVHFHGGADPAMQFHEASTGPLHGRFGVRAWGSGVSLENFRWTSGGKSVAVWTPKPSGWAQQKALESACLVVMNLNEVLYVD